MVNLKAFLCCILALQVGPVTLLTLASHFHMLTFKNCMILRHELPTGMELIFTVLKYSNFSAATVKISVLNRQ